MKVEVEGRVQALREEAARLRAQAEGFEAQGLPYAASVSRHEAGENEAAAAREERDGKVQTVVKPLALPVHDATVTLTPAERTVPLWLPVAALVALLIVAAGLGLLIGHLVHGGI